MKKHVQIYNISIATGNNDGKNTLTNSVQSRITTDPTTGYSTSRAKHTHRPRNDRNAINILESDYKSNSVGRVETEHETVRILKRPTIS